MVQMPRGQVFILGVMGNYKKMKSLQQKISIIGFSIFILGLVGCENSTDSNVSQNLKVDSVSADNKQEIVSELTKEKSLSEELKNKTDFNLPEGYELLDKIQGDLNGDGLDDYVLILKGTEKKNIVINRFDEEVDLNRRGILVYLTENDKTVLTTKNLSCFSSENEDGGGYFPPQLSIDIENGNLFVHYGHGRYGYLKYTFKHQNSDFELIGYDSSDNYGPIINRETSINFLTKKKLTRENVNQNAEESGDEIFEENWGDIELEKLFSLAEIKDFDSLDIN